MTPPIDGEPRLSIGLDRSSSWYEATARERIRLLLDPGTFREFIAPSARAVSPHLKIFDLPEAFDDGIAVGRGELDGKPVFVAAQEGQFMGGAFGEVHGAKLTGLLRAARDVGSVPVLLLLDTGGVRLQEANAGELAVAEIMRAVLEARRAGVAVVALIGGRAGCYGGGGLIAACCSAIAVSEEGRIGVSGPQVIETNRGVEEFDAQDRALIWRTMGGKHRYLTGGADAFADDTVQSFRDAALALLAGAARFGPETLAAEQVRLARRLEEFGGARDGSDAWSTVGVPDSAGVPDMPTGAFVTLADRVRRVAHDTR